MKRIAFKPYYLLLPAFLLLIQFSHGQDTIPAPIIVDSVTVDSIAVDTIVIRRTVDKIYSPRKDVNLQIPNIDFKKTKTLQKGFQRFRVPSFWETENSFGINISEVAFVNWNAGGDNAISGLGFLKFARKYKFSNFQWENNLELRYGLNAQEGQKLRKTEDVIRLTSNLGFKKDNTSRWFYSVQLNFNTQFSNGYKYPDRDTPISRFMAPGYLLFGAGTSYITKDEKFNLYLSPLTQKSTFVLDQDLADNGAFGVEEAELDADGNVITPGENHLLEIGILITNNFNYNIADNIELKSRLNLYTDYIKSFGNVDVDWELTLNMKVNKFISTSLGTQMIYDDDILFDVVKNDNGTIVDPGTPKIQFKQVLGVGLLYGF
ncbi:MULTISPECIES: DUF3078 domain-containing protein [Maribacter]|uniref:DUF3078 domain-containing protein n=1 Tax=Maribacter dokdonensis TaxID=320912 RepID=A0ABY0UVV7_9FLAO|nr:MULTISPECIES: DUF3078 domain-containing protein [Maribacter]MBU2900373.1 DUF3078 domain-containing protein [Maribacter dokdonensis]MDP2526522.1 DUF3078 domain-containing protein [Maribacter dokdonensis]SDT26232.1 Protein of unknown function [Maribacter dokdonensis]|tara:strand:+ start:3623 stop:4750 length:1128 start_codon:yes stop_codon:yes gene_type:complete